MARPTKNTVDYFPHIVKSGKTIFILESKFGNDGYAFWFKLLELLAQTNGHYYDCNNSQDWLFLVAKTRVSEVSVTEILNTLSDLEAIDKELWVKRIIWSQNFVDNISDVYKKRQSSPPKRPEKFDNFVEKVVSGDENPSIDEVLGDGNPSIGEVSVDGNRQSKVNKSIINNTPPTPPGVVTDKKFDEQISDRQAKTLNQDEQPKKKKAKTQILSLVQQNRFDRFWIHYPRKKSKGRAEKAWAIINPDEQLLETMISKIEQAKKSREWLKDGGKYIQHPATWIYAKGWEDEFEIEPEKHSPNLFKYTHPSASQQEYEAYCIRIAKEHFIRNSDQSELEQYLKDFQKKEGFDDEIMKGQWGEHARKIFFLKKAEKLNLPSIQEWSAQHAAGKT